MDDLYIVDISNLMHRAFYVHQDLATPAGFPTGAIMGTFSMLVNMIKKYDIKDMLICYDHPGQESFRKSIYPGYKASRGAKGSISAQELIIRRVIELLGISTVEQAGYEADDLIASAVKKFKPHRNIVIVTGDKDLLQLIDTNVTVLDTMKKCFYGDDEVQKKFGVKANQISDFLAIAGDKVDDIPGVKGVGKVGAGKLLAEYGTLEEIYKNIVVVKGALGRKMAADEDNAFLSRRLSHLYDNLDIQPDDMRLKPQYSEELLQLFERLHFSQNTKKLQLLWSRFNVS